MADRAIRAVVHRRTQRGPSTALSAALAAFSRARALPDRFIGTFYDGTATSEQLLEVLAHLKTGTSELMCHPGYADEILIAGSVYNRQRERELVLLTSEEVRKAVEMWGIELTNFRGLPQKQKMQPTDAPLGA